MWKYLSLVSSQLHLHTNKWSDTIFDYCLNSQASGFVSWRETIPVNPYLEVEVRVLVKFATGERHPHSPGTMC